MNQFAERFVQQGEAQLLLRLLSVRFGELRPEIQKKVESADADTLLHWSERVLSAKTLDEVLH